MKLAHSDALDRHVCSRVLALSSVRSGATFALSSGSGRCSVPAGVLVARSAIPPGSVNSAQFGCELLVQTLLD